MNHIEHVGQQRVNPGCSTGLIGLRMSPRDISPKEQTQEQSETHAGQSSVLSSSARLAGLPEPGCSGLLWLMEALDYIFP